MGLSCTRAQLNGVLGARGFKLQRVELHRGSVARWFCCMVVQLLGGSVAWGSVTRWFNWNGTG